MDYCKNKRSLLPKTYNERKMCVAQQHNENLGSWMHQRANDDDEYELEVDAQKAEISEQVAMKMNAMSNLYMDLTEAEVNLYQNIVEGSESDSDGESPTELSPIRELTLSCDIRYD